MESAFELRQKDPIFEITRKILVAKKDVLLTFLAEKYLKYEKIDCPIQPTVEF